MKRMILGFYAAALLLALSSLCIAQNVTINLEPINPPIQIPGPGGSFNYNVTLSNTGSSPQGFDTWIMAQLPGGSWYGPVFGPVTLSLPSGASISRQRTQLVPGTAPAGTFVYEGRVGVYPNTIWNTSNFSFTKTLEGSEIWVARYNGPGNGTDQPSSVKVDGAGNVYVTGYSNGVQGNADYATIKYNSAGQQQWVATYNGPGNSYDHAHGIVVDGVGNVYVTGSSMGSGTEGDYATIKYNTAGQQLWVARYNGPGNGSDGAISLAVDGNDNVYVTGSSDGIVGMDYNNDYATIKYNSAGQQQWVTRYNGLGNGDDQASFLAVDGAGNVYVTGYSDGEAGSGNNYDYATIKYNASGNQQWVARYNGLGNSSDLYTSLAVDGSGNVYVTGISEGSGTHYDYATIKYNSAGQQQWEARYYGLGNGDDRARSIAVDEDGNVYVTGESEGSETYYDYATIKYDSTGQTQWVARYAGPGYSSDIAYSLVVDGDGYVYVTGSSMNDYATIKYNAAGQQQWVARYNGPANSADDPCDLVVDGHGNVHVTGTSYGSMMTGQDYCTVKYSGGTIANWQPVEALVFGVQEPVTEYQLHPCYPNPFNATTVLRYKIQDASFVSLRVYDTAGRLVETLVNGWREAGEHEVTFDGSALPSGVYVYRLEARKGAYAPGELSAAGKMVLLK